MTFLEIVLGLWGLYWLYNKYREWTDAVESRRDAAESAHKYLSRFTVATSLSDLKAPRIEVPTVIKNSRSIEN